MPATTEIHVRVALLPHKYNNPDSLIVKEIDMCLAWAATQQVVPAIIAVVPI